MDGLHLQILEGKNWIYNCVDKNVNRTGQKEQKREEKKVETDAQNLTLYKLECYCFKAQCSLLVAVFRPAVFLSCLASS